MKNLYWVGIRESDIFSCSSLYSGSITFYGSNRKGNISLFHDDSERLNHNSDNIVFENFYSEAMHSVLKKDPKALFMFYNQSMAYKVDKKLQKKIICVNSESLLKILNNKILCKIWLKQCVPMLPNVQILNNELSMEYAKSLFPGFDKFVLQPDISSGGHGTFLITEENCTEIKEQLNEKVLYSLSPYYNNSIPINVHAIISKNNISIYPPSIQIVKEHNNQLVYFGGDFLAYGEIPEEINIKLTKYSKNICKKMQRSGYCGVCGIDFIIKDENIYFMEINPRFQASTFVLNHALAIQKKKTINEVCIDMFFERQIINNESVSIKVNYSFFTYSNISRDSFFYKYIFKKYFALNPQYSTLKDGYTENTDSENDSYLFRCIFPHNIISVFENTIRTAEVITGFKINSTVSIVELKIMLIMFGITISEKAREHIKQNGEIREANFSAIDIVAFEKVVINCPYNIGLSIYSPFCIDLDNNCLYLTLWGYKISKVNLYPESKVNNKTTTSGINFSSIAFLATDRLRVNHSSVCYYKSIGKHCKFCNLPFTNQKYSKDDIYEVVKQYLVEEKFNHILIGGGSAEPDDNFENIIDIAKFIRLQTDMPLYLMSTPPRNKKVIHKLCDSGINELAFNIEVFDRNLAKKYMPGKGLIPLSQYYSAYAEAEKRLTKNDIRCMIVLGIDDEKTVLNGIKKLCKIGVQPMLSVFRPMPNTPMENQFPISWLAVYELYIKAQKICSQYKIRLGPSCISCQNNTISIPEEMETKTINIPILNAFNKN